MRSAVDPLAFIRVRSSMGVRAAIDQTRRRGAGPSVGHGRARARNYATTSPTTCALELAAGRDRDIALIDHVMNELDDGGHQDSELLLRRAA